MIGARDASGCSKHAEVTVPRWLIGKRNGRKKWKAEGGNAGGEVAAGEFPVAESDSKKFLLTVFDHCLWWQF
jgi:hypothetical protein